MTVGRCSGRRCRFRSRGNRGGERWQRRREPPAQRAQTPSICLGRGQPRGGEPCVTGWGTRIPGGRGVRGQLGENVCSGRRKQSLCVLLEQSGSTGVNGVGGDVQMWPRGRAGGGAGRTGQGTFGCRWLLCPEKWLRWRGAVSCCGLAQASGRPGPEASRGTRGRGVGAAVVDAWTGRLPTEESYFVPCHVPGSSPFFPRVFWSVLLLLCWLLAVLCAVMAVVGGGAGWLRPL